MKRFGSSGSVHRAPAGVRRSFLTVLALGVVGLLALGYGLSRLRTAPEPSAESVWRAEEPAGREEAAAVSEAGAAPMMRTEQ